MRLNTQFFARYQFLFIQYVLLLLLFYFLALRKKCLLCSSKNNNKRRKLIIMNHYERYTIIFSYKTFSYLSEYLLMHLQANIDKPLLKTNRIIHI